MNHFVWIGIIMWGALVTGFGILSMPAEPGANAGGGMEAHDVLFLLAGGLISCLIGIVGLLGVMGWIPGLHRDKESA
jgi:hypothetical protein